MLTFLSKFKANETNLILDWENVDIKRDDIVMISKYKEDCPSNLNEDSFSVQSFGYKVMFDEYLNYCSSLGGTELVPSSQDDLLMIHNTFKSSSESKCNNKFWAPIRQAKKRKY